MLTTLVSVAGLLVLRVGVPLLVTLSVGEWLRRRAAGEAAHGWAG